MSIIIIKLVLLLVFAPLIAVSFSTSGQLVGGELPSTHVGAAEAGVEDGDWGHGGRDGATTVIDKQSPPADNTHSLQLNATFACDQADNEKCGFRTGVYTTSTEFRFLLYVMTWHCAQPLYGQGYFSSFIRTSLE